MSSVYWHCAEHNVHLIKFCLQVDYDVDVKRFSTTFNIFGVVHVLIVSECAFPYTFKICNIRIFSRNFIRRPLCIFSRVHVVFLFRWLH